MGAHLGFPVWAARLLIEGCAHPGALCLCTQASGLLIWHTDPRLCSPAADQGVYPLEVSCVGGQLGFHLWAPSLWFQLWASNPLIWVCATGLQMSAGAAYPGLHSPGAAGVGAQEAMAAAENSLNSP